MVQEVQIQWNRYKTPDRIEWIWVSERKVSDHTQVREKWTNGCYAETTLKITNSVESVSSSWTVTWDDEVKYKTIWGKLYIPLAWTYLIKFKLYHTYGVSYTDKFRIYSWKRVIYTYDTTLADKDEHQILLDLWRKNDISVSLYATGLWWQVLYIDVQLQIVKL